MPSEKFNVRCPHCKSRLSVPSTREQVRCPKCQGMVPVIPNRITSSPVMAIPQATPSFPDGLNLHGRNKASAPPTNQMGFFAYYAKHWTESRGGIFFKTCLSLLTITVMSFMKPLIHQTGMVRSLVCLIGLALVAFVVYTIKRVVGFILIGNREVNEGDRSGLAWVAHFGFVSTVFIWGPVIAAELLAPERGLTATLIPPLREKQDRLLSWIDPSRPQTREVDISSPGPTEDSLQRSAPQQANELLTSTRAKSRIDPPPDANSLVSEPGASEKVIRKSIPGRSPSATGLALDPVADVVVVAEGVGETPEEAIKDAYRNAVRQVVGAVVDAETLVKDDEVIADKVLTYSDGFIEKTETLGESHKGGLYRKRVQATVKRRSVVSKLKDANVTITGFDGQSLFAEAVTQLEAEKSASALLEKALVGFPENVMCLEIAGKPRIVEKSEENFKCQYSVRVTYDQDKYATFLKRALPVLEKVALLKGELDLKGVPPGSINGESDKAKYPNLTRFSWEYGIGENSFGIWKFEKLDTKSDMIFVVNTSHNERNDRTTWKWFHATRPNAGLGHKLSFKIEFLDTNMEIVSHDKISTFDDLDGGLISSSQLPDRTVFPVFTNGKKDVVAIFGPYFFEREGGTYDISKYMNLYSSELVLTRELSLTPGELKRIAHTRYKISSD